MWTSASPPVQTTLPAGATRLPHHLAELTKIWTRAKALGGRRTCGLVTNGGNPTPGSAVGDQSACGPASLSRRVDRDAGWPGTGVVRAVGAGRRATLLQWRPLA